MAQVTKIAKEAKEPDNQTPGESSEGYVYKMRDFIEDQKAVNIRKFESKDDYFFHILASFTTTEILFEYCLFLRNLPPLLKSVKDDLITFVRKELKISEDDALSIQLMLNPRDTNLAPILDALSYKHGQSFTNILAPPTENCFMCEKTKQTPRCESGRVIHIGRPDLSIKI